MFFPLGYPLYSFFTLGLIFFCQRTEISYSLIFAIGTLNGDDLFLTLICIFILFRKEKGRNLIFHGLLQFLIWISIKIYLYHLFIANIGDGFIETKHLKDNIKVLTHLINYPLLFSGVILFVWVPTLAFSGLIKDEFVKKSIWVSIPFFIGMILIGAINEIQTLVN